MCRSIRAHTCTPPTVHLSVHRTRSFFIRLMRYVPAPLYYYYYTGAAFSYPPILRLWYVLALMRCLARPPISIVLVGASPTRCDLTGVDRMCIMHFWLDIVLFLSVSVTGMICYSICTRIINAQPWHSAQPLNLFNG